MGEWNDNDTIFRGYFFGDDTEGSDGKSPRKGEKIKGASGHSFDEVSDSECFGAALRDGYVDISFDSTDMLETFLDMAEDKQWKCLVLKSRKGGHTYWKKPKQIKKDGKDITLACGLVADIHSKNTYIPLRVHGEDRFPPEYDIFEDEGEEYQEVPEELLPVKTTIKLWNMKYGEGRNDELFKYILILQSQLGLDENKIREMYRGVINKYILADPLDDAELEVILRDEAFESQVAESFWDDGKFLHTKCAEFMIKHEKIIRIHKKAHIYKNGIYTLDNDSISRKIREYVPTIRRNQKAEVIDCINDIAEEKRISSVRYITFRNGIYDLVTDRLQDFTPDIILTNMIPWDYKPAAYSEIADRTLANVSDGDPDIRALLEECIGYSFYRGTELRKAFIFTGDKRNGKSTFLRMLQNVLGEDNYTTLDIGDLGGRFNGSALYGKLANIADDIKDSFFEGSQLSLFKKIVSGDEIFAEFKGKDGFKFKPYATIIGSANEIPHMRDWTGAALDRMIFVPFTRTFSPADADYDPELPYKLEDEEVMEYLIAVGIKALRRILKNKQFSQSNKVDEMIENYAQENDSVIAFINERDAETEIINNTTDEVFRSYQVFCRENNRIHVEKITFIKRVNRYLDIKSDSRKTKLGSKKCFVPK